MHLAEHGRLTLDARRTRGRLEDFLQRQNRFSSLTRKDPRGSEELHHQLQVSQPLEMDGMRSRVRHALARLLLLLQQHKQCASA